jgi:lipopolysaccharide heptosyltransferase II
VSPVVPLPSAGRLKRRFKSLVAAVANPGVGMLAGMVGNAARVPERSFWPFEQDPDSILLVRFDVLGDTAMSLPLAFDLKERFPGASVVFATTPASAPLVKLCPFVDDVLVVDAPSLTHLQSGWRPSRWQTALQFVTALRRQGFDLAISLYGPLSGPIVGLSGARWRVGFDGEAAPGNFDFAFPGGRGPGTRHEIDWVRQLGGRPGGDLPSNLIFPGRAERDWMRRELAPVGSRRRVVIHPGARTGSAKLWPERHWRELIDSLAGDDSVEVVVTGGSSEPAAGSRLLAGHGEPHQNISGRTSIPQLAALLETADLTVSADSGPLHLAALLGRPALGIYGPTDPGLSGPFGPLARTIVTDLPCHPCYDLRAPAICPFGDALCMEWITPSQVLREIAATLDSEDSD